MKKHQITKTPRIKFLHVYVLPITVMEPAAEQLFHRGNSFPDSLPSPPPPPVTKETKMLLSSLRICGGGVCVHTPHQVYTTTDQKEKEGSSSERHAGEGEQEEERTIVAKARNKKATVAWEKEILFYSVKSARRAKKAKSENSTAG